MHQIQGSTYLAWWGVYNHKCFINALPKNDSPNHFYLRISATPRFILGTVASSP